jgi:hypothetical protein
VLSRPCRGMMLTFLVFLWAACEHKVATPKPKTPWGPSLAEYFDDSVDFTINPQSLSGQWLFKYQEQLKVRMARSEHVMGISITSVTKKTDPDGKECKDIYAAVKAQVKGEWDKDTVTLRVCDTSAGFDSFREEDGRLFERAFIAFVKLYTLEDGSTGIHWHLSPLSQGLKDGMDGILKESKEKKKKTDSKKYIYETNQ